MLSNKSWGRKFARAAVGEGLTGHQLAGGEQLAVFCITCFSWFYFPLGLGVEGFLLWDFLGGLFVCLFVCFFTY